MSFAEKFSVIVTTETGGAVTAYLDGVTGNGLTGRVASLTYTKHGTLNYTDGVDFTITSEATGQSIWTDTNINATETVYPVAPANLGSSGAASSLTEVPIFLVRDRIKIVIGSGGDGKIGTFTVVMN